MMYVITNRHLNNFLEEHGLYPKYEDDRYDIAWYERNHTLYSLLEDYNIRHNYFKNKQ